MANMAESSKVDEIAIRHYRLTRVRSLSTMQNVAAVLLFDPINIRYATGSRNMQVWTMHNFCRYTLLATNGLSVMILSQSRQERQEFGGKCMIPLNGQKNFFACLAAWRDIPLF